jgi:hypothetical protein
MDAETGRFLLNPAGVGDCQAAVEHQVHERDAAHRFVEHATGLQDFSVACCNLFRPLRFAPKSELKKEGFRDTLPRSKVSRPESGTRRPAAEDVAIWEWSLEK